MKKMNRRDFLKGLTACGCGVAASGIIPGLGQSLASAACQGNNTRLIIVEMAGGFDCLDVLEPQLGAAMQSIRPTLYKANGKVFGNGRLHNVLTNFHTQVDAGNLLAVQCVGPDNASRSHDEATTSYELGEDVRNSGQSEGWGNRLAQNLGCSSQFDCFDLTSGSNRTLVEGAYLPVSVNDPGQFGIDQLNRMNSNQNDFMQTVIFDMMSRASVASKQGISMQDGLGTVEGAVATIQNVVDSFNPSAGDFPNTGIGRDCEAAFMVVRDLGTRVVTVRQGGYDTHGDQDSRHDNLLGDLNDAVGALVSNLQAASLWNDTLVYFVSEFARTNAENSNAGTDHGKATTQFIMGGTVNGRVVNEISASDLSGPNWLEVKTNVTSVLKGIVNKMGGNSGTVIPGSHGALSI